MSKIFEKYLNLLKVDYSFSFGKSINIVSLIKSIYILKNSNLDIVYVSGLKISLILRFFLRINSRFKFVQAVRSSPFSNSNFDRLFRNTERFSKFFKNLPV